MPVDPTAEAMMTASASPPEVRPPAPKRQRASSGPLPDARPPKRTYDEQSCSGRPREPPHLQGFAPDEDPPLRTGGLDRVEARSSLGLSALQGFHPLRDGTVFAAPPLMALPDGRERPFRRTFRVSVPVRLAGLSRDCRPSWASSPHDLHERESRPRFGSRLLRLRGTSPSPRRAIFEPSFLLGRSRS